VVLTFKKLPSCFCAAEMQVCDGNYCHFPVVNLTTKTFCYGRRTPEFKCYGMGRMHAEKMAVLAEQLAIQGQKGGF
jgi:hypothetical protein